jgi:hypothetical protein
MRYRSRASLLVTVTLGQGFQRATTYHDERAACAAVLLSQHGDLDCLQILCQGGDLMLARR